MYSTVRVFTHRLGVSAIGSGAAMAIGLRAAARAELATRHLRKERQHVNGDRSAHHVGHECAKSGGRHSNEEHAPQEQTEPAEQGTKLENDVVGD